LSASDRACGAAAAYDDGRIDISPFRIGPVQDFRAVRGKLAGEWVAARPSRRAGRIASSPALRTETSRPEIALIVAMSAGDKACEARRSILQGQ
jgi:hypothetical protein